MSSPSNTPIKLSGPGTFQLDIVGESYYQDNLETICGPRTPQGENRIVEAALIVDDDNPYDKNAVRVEIDGLTVGYLGRDHAPRYRRQLKRTGHPKATATCQALIKGGWDRGRGNLGHYGVKLDLAPEAITSSQPAGQPRPAQAAPQKPQRSTCGTVALLSLIGVAACGTCVFLAVIIDLI